MVLLLPCSFVVLLILVEVGTGKEEVLCERQNGHFVFKPKEGVKSLDLKDAQDNRMLHWLSSDGQCHPYKDYTRPLTIVNCNMTHIEFELHHLTQQDNGNITLSQGSEQTVLDAQTVTVARTVFLNKSCTLYEERKLRCENIEDLYNRNVQVKDAANNILLNNAGCSFLTTLPETGMGPFRVVLDANPMCYVPLTFELRSGTSSGAAAAGCVDDKKETADNLVPLWHVFVAVICTVIGTIGLIICVLLMVYRKLNETTPDVERTRGYESSEAGDTACEDLLTSETPDGERLPGYESSEAGDTACEDLLTSDTTRDNTQVPKGKSIAGSQGCTLKPIEVKVGRYTFKGKITEDTRPDLSPDNTDIPLQATEDDDKGATGPRQTLPEEKHLPGNKENETTPDRDSWKGARPKRKRTLQSRPRPERSQFTQM